MSRSDRIVNILLALAWVLLIVRVGRIYFDSTNPAAAVGASGADSLDEPIPSPIVLVRSGPGLRAPPTRTRAPPAPRPRAPSPLPLPAPAQQPTPTAITGPQELRPIVGKCHYFLATDGSQKFEFCAFRSVRQILLSNYRSVVTGHWKGWKTEEKDGKKLMIQEYENGDECPGFGKRYTLVEYTVRWGLSSGPAPAAGARRRGPAPASHPPAATHSPNPLPRSARRRPRGWSSCPSPSMTCASTA